MKASEFRPCDNCKGVLGTVFYRMTISFRQMLLNQRAVQSHLGLAAILGGSERLAMVMGPADDLASETPAYQIDKDIILCQNCLLEYDLNIGQMMSEHEDLAALMDLLD